MRACELQIQSKPLLQLQNLLVYLADRELLHTKARTHLNKQKEINPHLKDSLLYKWIVEVLGWQQGTDSTFLLCC